MKTIAILAAGVLTLAACETTKTTTTIPVQVCSATAYQGLVGQNKNVLDGMTVPANTRIIEPGMAVTLDHNPNRLNIEVDARDRITVVRCG